MIAAVLLAAGLAQSPSAGLRVDVHAIEVSASVRDARGEVPRDLKPADFVLLEDGKPQRIISVDYLHEEPPSNDVPATKAGAAPRARQIVVFLQQSLSTTDGLRAAMHALAGQAERLCGMGEVEVISDFPKPHSMAPPTRSATFLRAFLEKLGREIEGREELITIRTAFMIGDTPTDSASPAATSADALGRSDQVRMRARREWMTLRSREDAMLAWLHGYPRHAENDVRTLIFVSDGFDLEPGRFYRLTDDIRRERQTELRDWSAASYHEQVARSLAAEGWTIVPVAMGSNVVRATRFDPQSRADRGPWAPIDVLHNAHAAKINADPLAPLERLADATGGAVVTDVSQIASRLAAVDQRIVITYQVDRAVDEKTRAVEVRAARPGLTVRSQRFVGTGPTETMAAATATTLAKAIAGGEPVDSGGLSLTCAIRLGENVRGIRNSDIDFRTEPDENATRRVTLAVIERDGTPFTATRLLETGQSSTTISVRHRDGARMAIVVTDTSTGVWGTCAIDAPKR